jgi:hypothetical protein
VLPAAVVESTPEAASDIEDLNVAAEAIESTPDAVSDSVGL